MILKILKELEVEDLSKLNMYIDFCISKDRGRKYKNTEEHHILPKSIFPNYKNLKEFTWNSSHLKYEDHYIAHSMLAEAINNDSFIYAWNAMNSINNKSKNIVPIGMIRYKELREKHKKIVSVKQSERNKNKEFIEQRRETLSKIKESGLTGFQESGLKISKALKGRVQAINLKTLKKEHITQEEFRTKWFYVGNTAKFLKLFEMEGILYTEEGLKEDKNILLKDYFKMRTNKPFKNKSFDIIEVHNDFEYYSSKISINS